MDMNKKMIRVSVIIIINSICVATNLPINSIDILSQQQIDFFENDTSSTVNGSLYDKYAIDKRSIFHEDIDGFRYLNVGVLMASHLGKQISRFPCEINDANRTF